MNSRRDFLKKAALLSGSAALMNVIPPVIQKALAIDPAVGSTFYDAEHVVFLMQENRSFDHMFGTLQGVRGFNDPRAISQPNKNKVWLQSSNAGETYVPFRLNTHESKVPWMGSTPHNWTDQTDVRNNGKYNKWIDLKKAYNKAYAHIPFTMGYCDRSDFPFYYSLADAFTVCDQNFCSSITGTHPNRHYWMTGTVRESNDVAAKAHLWNVNNYDYPELEWKTYPERLEEQGVSWKVYQNEVTIGFGLKGEESGWLSNYGTNVLEYYKQYNIRLHPGSISNLQIKKDNILKEIASLENQKTDENSQKLAAAKKVLAKIEADEKTYSKDKYSALNDRAAKLNSKAFTVNKDDPDYHNLVALKYDDQGTERELNIPKGDILHQFREDVKNGSLPTVSWLMSPANFSDHPGQPWFGSWYVSEVMEILLQNPEVWKKTIFVLTYDENDGFFDHVPPYAVPNPYKENTGKVSAGIDPRMDFVTKDQQTNPSSMDDRLRESSIGLGYRVPMIVASPWTRGGYVCSELFDHTSSLQFLENFLDKKFSKKVTEENITNWRRTICGDLTSVFRPYNGEKISEPKFLPKNQFIESIHKSKFKDTPHNFKNLTPEEIEEINTDPTMSPHFPKQEKGTRPACAIPYELYVDGEFNPKDNTYGIKFKAGNKVFGGRSAGSPFLVYAMNPYQKEEMRTWEYSVKAGDTLSDQWNISDFDEGNYHIRVYGPNGFYREFSGNKNNPKVAITFNYQTEANGKLTGNAEFHITNNDVVPHTIELFDNSYKSKSLVKTVPAGSKTVLMADLSKNYNWYDLTVKVKTFDALNERFAGHVETGAVTKTDPLMGGLI